MSKYLTSAVVIKRVFIVIILFHIQSSTPSFGQKRVIGLEDLNTFESVNSPLISNDGKFVLINITSRPSVLYSLQNNHRLQIPYAFDFTFSGDSKRMMFRRNDTLGIVELETNTIRRINGIQNFQVNKDSGGHLLAYQLKSNMLVLHDFIKGSEISFPGVSKYWLSSDALIVCFTGDQNAPTFQRMLWVDLKNNEEKEIWRGYRLSDVAIDWKSQTVAFLSQDTILQKQLLWLFKRKGESLIKAPLDGALPLDLTIAGFFKPAFTPGANAILFKVKGRDEKRNYSLNSYQPDIYSYNDLQSQFVVSADQPSLFQIWVYRIDSGNCFRVSAENETTIPLTVGNKFAILIKSNNGATTEWYWNQAAEISWSLKSLLDGSEKNIFTSVPGGRNCGYQICISPDEDHIVYYNGKKKNYFSYEIPTGKIKCITNSFQEKWEHFNKTDIPRASWMTGPLTGNSWVEDSVLLIRAQEDIYKINVVSPQKSVCLTKGLGRRKNIVFDLAIGASKFSPNVYLLNAFNRNTKENGFYLCDIAGAKNPIELTMQPAIFQGSTESSEYSTVPPIKAKDANVFVVQKMSAASSPNYYVTRNFKDFSQITYVYPERKFNWLTSELYTWKNGTRMNQGILYKPENFDSTKKYPVIFYYYERMSNDLHVFHKPEAAMGSINVPYLVSNGYVVFIPDIYYEIGSPGSSAVATIVSAARNLAKEKWVDIKKMAVHGHSRGGYQTNFVVTHSNLFAAAVSGSGMSDYISLYSQRQSGFEVGPQRIGYSLWERPDLYIDNSPIFSVNRVTTPVLMMHNKNDGDVPFLQGYEFYSGLRRMGKRVWLLQYDNGGHMIDGEDALDYTIRIKQFFDHYLKDSACPRWMLYGIDAKDKGKIDGLDLVKEKDPKTGKWLTPKEGGLLTDEEKKKVEALKHRKPVTVTIE
jgi:predicted esterase